MRGFAAFAAVALVLATISSSALAADAAAGQELARRWCAACHLVAADQQRVPEVAPPFAAIAKKPGFDERHLARMLQWPHPAMPDRALSREEAAAIAAYIATFAK